MKKEFNLSEKILHRMGTYNSDNSIHIKDIKEFIKREHELLWSARRKEITWVEFWEKRNKLVGNDLI